MEKEIVELRDMLKRWKKESDAFFKRVERYGYEPNFGVSHIWSNLSSACEVVSDVLDDWGEG